MSTENTVPNAKRLLWAGFMAILAAGVGFALRGGIFGELHVEGASQDLHSGVYGGASPNPIFALAEMLTKLKDENGKILVPGMYDDVTPPTAEEKASWDSLPFDEEEFRKTEVGSTQLTGEPGFSVMERTWARPTLEVHGIRGGFTGEGAKTVIPARAVAKISMRLVADQQIDEAISSGITTMLGGGLGRKWNLIQNTRAAASYVTGTHAIKGGLQYTFGESNLKGSVPGGLAYNFLNQRPFSLTMWQTPTEVNTRSRALGLLRRTQVLVRGFLNVHHRLSDLRHAAFDRRSIIGADDALRGQHLGVGQRAPNVGRPQPLVKEHAGGVALDQVAHGFAEQSGPSLGLFIELVGCHPPILGAAGPQGATMCSGFIFPAQAGCIT